MRYREMQIDLDESHFEGPVSNVQQRLRSVLEEELKFGYSGVVTPEILESASILYYQHYESSSFYFKVKVPLTPQELLKLKMEYLSARTRKRVENRMLNKEREKAEKKEYAVYLNLRKKYGDAT